MTGDAPEGPAYSIAFYDSYKLRSPEDDRDGEEGPAVIECIGCGRQTFATTAQAAAFGAWTCQQCMELLWNPPEEES